MKYPRPPSSGLYPNILTLTVLLLIHLWLMPGIAPVNAQGFSFPLNETFKGPSASGWVLGGTAYLTSGNPDPAGDGWLRLTRNTTYQAGYAYYNTPIPTGRGLVITFDYASWGGTGADGLSFFLFDGATPTFNVGASGGSLGYAQKTGVSGLSGGYLGLGLDEFGNYSNPTEGRVGGPGFIKNAVAVRGPGSGTTGYNYLAGTTSLTASPWNLPRLDCQANFTGFTNIGVTNGSCGTGATRPAPATYYRQVQITLTPVGSAYAVTVAMKFGPSDSWRTLFGPFTMPTSAPGTLKMGFAASTGGSTNYHEIRNLVVTQQVPDLTATKAVQNATTGGGSVAPGEQLLYTVVLKNNTSTAITGVSFSDPIPTNTTYVANSATASSGTVSYNDGTRTLSVTGISVPGNGQATITFRVLVNNPLPAGVTTISNQGSYTYGSTTAQTDGDSVIVGEQPTVISVTAGPNFDTSTKTVSVFNDTAPLGEVSPGDTLLYRVVLPNSGNQDSPTTTFTDVLPSNTTYVAGSATASTGTVSYNSTTKTLTWVASINAGSQATLEFKVTVNSGVKIRDVISNQGTVTYGGTSVLTDADLTTPGKQPTVLLVGGQATLVTTKVATVLSPPLQPGGQISYTVVLTNTGSYAVSGATFVDTMPANTTYVSGSATTTSGSISYDSGARTLNVSGISVAANGGTATIRFRVQLDNPLPTGVTQVSNQGVASWDANNSGSNNTSLATDSDPATAGQQPTVTTLTNADLAVTKTINNANPAENEVIVYTVRITNTGSSAVTNAVVSDTLPTGLTLVSSSATQGSYTSPTWSVGALASGASAALTINARVNLGQGGNTITNTATASSELYDANAANNTADVSLTVKTTVLTGVVTDKDTGAVLAGVSVKVTDSQSNTCTATTGSDGRYTVTSGVSGCLLAPGAATVEATAAPSGYLLTSTNTTITAGVTNTQDLALVRPRLNGVVTDAATGTPIAGATVTLTQGSSTCTTTTGTGGTYSFVAGTGSPPCNFTAGAATVSAAQTGYQTDTKYPVISSTGPTTQNLTLNTADLLVIKDDGKTVVYPAERLDYVLTVSNNGSITAQSVTLTDTLPTYLTYVGWATNDSGITLESSANPYVWSLGDLAPGTSKSITLTATVATSLPNGTTELSNYARASTVSPEANITNNERADTDTVTAHPDLTLFKSAVSDSVPIRAGGTITYTYNGDNRGSATATGVTITDTLDVHTTYVDGSAELVVLGTTWPVTATYTDSIKTLVLYLPDMPPGAEGYLRYRATVDDPLPGGTTLITNTAQVTSKESDLDSTNNRSTLVLSAESGANVYVDKTAVAAAKPAVPGSEIVYLLRYGNLGDQVATNAVLTDAVPANTTLVAGSITGGGTESGGVITWALGNLAVGASGQVSFTVRITDVLPAGVESITNTAQIASSVYDPAPGDNQSTATTEVSAQPDLVVRKSHSGTYFEANQTVTYTLTYSNTGNQAATGVVITDTLDEQLTYISSSPAGTYDSGTHTILWSIGGLGVDGEHTIVLTATVSASAAGKLIVNRAEIGDDGTNGSDADPASNTISDVVRVARPILILEKSATGQAYVTGQITYTLTYRNDGPVAARSVVISDVLPANTTLVAGSITGGGSYDDGTRTITWNLGNLTVGASGQVGFAVTVGAGAGGATQSAATLSSESASGSLVITSTAQAVNNPWCSTAGCSTIKGYWGGANPVGPAGWEANPQLPGAAFDDSAWTTVVEPTAPEPYWMSADSLAAQWVAVITTTQYARNYSFFRQYFYLPPNARGFSGSLQIAGDDVVDVYVNGRFIGTHYGGGGGASTMDVSSAVLAGVNLLAVRLANNTHNGHDIYSGGDHPGLLYRLEVSFQRLVPFAAAPAMTLEGQQVTFTMQEWLRGKPPFEYVINFGDNTTSGDYTQNTSIQHTYTTPGVYTATVTARDQLGSVATDTLIITVLESGSNLLANRATTGYENVVGVSYAGETGAGVELGLAADLSVVKTVKAGGTTPGQGVTYQIVVTNNGPDAVTGAAVTDTVPAAVTGVTWTCEASGGGSCAHNSGNGNTIDETVNLPSGATATYTIQGVISPAATGTLANTATVAAPSGVTDPTPGDDSSTASTDLTPSVNLSVTKTSTPNPGVAPGGGISYIIVVSNSGPSDAVGVSVADTLPAALTNVAWTCAASSGSTCSASGSGNIADSATIAAGKSITYTVRGTVDAGTAVGTTLANTATATYGGTSVEDTDDNTLVAWASLSATKDALNGAGASSRTVPFVDADGNGGISPGDTLKYRVIITNTSANTAYNIIYRDTLDANTALTVGSVSCDSACVVTQGNNSGDTEVNVSIASMAGSSFVTIYYQATVKTTLPFRLDRLSNQGQVAASNAPSLATDDPATAESDDPTVLTLAMGAISGVTWRDDDNDGIKDTGEPTLANFAVTLYYAGADGNWDTDDDRSVYGLTDGSGAYNFDYLPAGKYRVGFTPLLGFVFSQYYGTGRDSKADPATSLTDELDLAANQQMTGVSAGLVSQMDFGNLPAEYAATTLADDGARHIVVEGGLHLGNTIQADNDGASGTTPADNDGIMQPGKGAWKAGETSSLIVTASGSGHLWGWFDWNRDGDLNDTGELVDLGVVITGTQAVTLTIPSGFTDSQPLYVRFRLYPEDYAQEVTPYGVVYDGEVEDYKFDFPTPTRAILSRFDAAIQNDRIIVEWETVTEDNTAGFFLYREETDGRMTRVNEQIIPAFLGTSAGGIYRLLDRGVVPGGTYTYVLEEIEAGGQRHRYGPFTIPIGRSTTEAAGRPIDDQTAYFRIPRPASLERRMSAAEPNRHIEASDTMSTTQVRPETLRLHVWLPLVVHAFKDIQPPVTSVAAKLTVRTSGLYYLAADDIAPVLGLSTSEVKKLIQTNKLNLTNQGQTIPYLAADNNAGIYFYGQGIASPYAVDNVYWLIYAKGQPMETLKHPSVPPAVPLSAFRATSHAEQNVYPAPGLFRDPLADYWMWDYLVAGDASLGRKNFIIPANGATRAGDASLTVRLLGVTAANAGTDHHARILLNGTVIGDISWAGAVPHETTLPVNAALLRDGANTIEVVGLLDAGIPYSIFYVNSFDLNYQRYTRAVNDVLLFRSTNATASTVYGFSNNNVMVFDVSNPTTPVRLSAIKVEAWEGAYRVTFKPAAADASYLAIATTAVPRVTTLIADTPSNLKGPNAADYVIVTTADMRAPAQTLAAYRQSQGLQTKVVDIQDIYDEFNGGVASPDALSDFLAYAYANWRPAPRYVLLAGAGSYDYKNYQGYGDSLVPPIMVGTTKGLTAADTRYGDVRGDDGVPEIAIGRLPALTATEFAAYVSKIQAYEAAAPADWSRQVLLLADNADPKAGNFPADSDALVTGLPSGYTAQKVYLGPLSRDQVRRQVQERLKAGVGIFNYIGHGGLDTLADEKLFTNADVAGLRNSPQLPFVSTATCVIGNYAFPGYRALGVLLALQADGGAAAIFAPTGSSLNAEGVALEKALFQVLFAGNGGRLGDAMRAALADFAANGGPRYALDIYNLLGDPATVMKWR